MFSDFINTLCEFATQGLKYFNIINQSQARNSGVTSVSDQAVARLRHGSGASVVKVSI